MDPDAPCAALGRRTFMLVALVAGAFPPRAHAGAHDAASTEPSPEAVLAHPEAYDPFAYALVVQWLWVHGRRQQAAFWFYMFQARTRPWALADKQGDGAAALRSALNDELGTIINAWVGSDLDAWRGLAERVVVYEGRLPLAPSRPAGLDAAAWSRLVDRSRTEYAAQLHAAFDGMAPETFSARCREGGLIVGPWVDPGPPLLETWR